MRLKNAMMLLGLVWAQPAQAEGGFFQRIGDASRTAFYESMCERMTRAPACYMTPMGTPVWQLKEPQRAQWLAIAQSVLNEAQDTAAPETAEEWEQLRSREAAMFCDFWQQQEDSARKREQLAQYCR